MLIFLVLYAKIASITIYISTFESMKKIGRHKNALVILLSQGMFICSSFATVFQWTDANNRVHYSDVPPVETVTSKVTTASQHTNQQKFVNGIKRPIEKHSRIQSTDATTNVKQKQQSLKNKNCNIAQRNLATLHKNYIILKNNNKLTKLSENQHAKKVNETEKQISEFC